MAARPELSLVIGSLDPGPVVFECLAALEAQRTGEVEILVVDASADDTADRVSLRFPGVRVIRASGLRSLPRLRGRGMAEASGAVIGVLDAWCVVNSGWVADALRVHTERPEPVAGGGVELAPAERRSVVAWATYLFDYWEFASPFATGPVSVLAGNNITYKRAVLDHPNALRSVGFWKAFTNARLKASGHGLWASPGLGVVIRRRLRLGRFLRSRYHHGRSYAAMRVEAAPWITHLKWALVTPALPLLFMARQLRGLVRKPVARGWFMLCAPLLLAFHVSWAFGELSGYLAGAGRSHDGIRS